MAVWILISIAILILVLGIIALVRAKGKKHKPDYYSFFIMGIIWAPFGIIMRNSDSNIGNIFFILGLVYLVIGLVNKDKWKANRRPYLIENVYWRWAVILGILVLGLVVGFLFYLRYGGI